MAQSCMEYTLTFTKEQLEYIRSAVCKINLKYCLKAHELKNDGNQHGYDTYMLLRNLGHTVLDIIDSQTEVTK